MSDLKNEFAYSWSRAEMFYRCPRQFYWQYYGSWPGWEDDAPATARLAYRLKHIKSVPMLIGDTFHWVVGKQLRDRPERPCGVPLKALHDEARQTMTDQMRSSREQRWRESPKWHANLFEDYYGGGLAPREAQEGLDALTKCLDIFADSGFGRRAFGAERSRLRIIDPQNFDQKRAVLEGLTVYATPDLLVEGKQGGTLHIVDWKTGRKQAMSLAQLAIYGWVVSAQYQLPIDKLTAHLVYVGHGVLDVEEFPDLAAGIDDAKRKIATFVDDVHERLTDVARNVAGDIDLFPMTNDLSKCRSCKFRELCGRMGETALAPADEGLD